jgi:hypothetical protein
MAGRQSVDQEKDCCVEAVLLFNANYRGLKQINTDVAPRIVDYLLPSLPAAGGWL